MRVVKYKDNDYLFYSKYQSDHSDIYAFPIEAESHISPLNVYNFDNWDGSFPETALISGTEETNNETRTFFAKLNLSPYNSELTTDEVIQSGSEGSNSQLIAFRFLYTGREFNIETGNYYYRARIMDSSLGRFTSKDPKKCYSNQYNYVKNRPLKDKDPMGKNPIEDTVSEYIEEWNSNPECANYFRNKCGMDLETLYKKDRYDITYLHGVGYDEKTRTFYWGKFNPKANFLLGVSHNIEIRLGNTMNERPMERVVSTVVHELYHDCEYRSSEMWQANINWTDASGMSMDDYREEHAIRAEEICSGNPEPY